MTILRLFKEKKLRIGVLMGGFDSERAISLRSGRAVIKALSGSGFPVKSIDIRDAKTIENRIARIDFAFICLHGKYGEDGTLQRWLEQHHIPYSGSGPRASKFAFDKALTKRIFLRHKIPTPRFISCRDIRTIKNTLAYPVVVKPCKEGSSVGISVAKNAKEFEKALKIASKFDPRVLIEEYISGREVTVGVLGRKALPVIEIVPKDHFFSFSAKYKDVETKYILKPKFTSNQLRLIQNTAIKAHNAIGCSGFSRVDIIYSRSGKPLVLEINTIPGMTERSLLPKAARQAGISYTRLCEKMIELSL